MREEGVEPTHLSVLEPKSSASASSATLAWSTVSVSYRTFVRRQKCATAKNMATRRCSVSLLSVGRFMLVEPAIEVARPTGIPRRPASDH